MSKLLHTTPKQDGFYAPIESTKHLGTWMIWPYIRDNWNHGAKPAQEVFAKIANTISEYEHIKMAVTEKQYETAKKLLSDKVELVKINYHDSWARDIGPIYLKNKKGESRAVKFHFDGWGFSHDPLSEKIRWNFSIDDAVGIKMAKNTDVDYYQAPMILEGGSIHYDGDGTLYTTAECLLNPNRNPNLSKDQIENYLKEYLNVEKVLWIPRGVYHDETNGHVDNLLHIAKPGHIVLTWTDDKNDPQYERSLEAYNFLTKTTDAKGRKIKITKIHQPNVLMLKEEEGWEGNSSIAFLAQKIVGNRMPASYANFYILNNAVIVPGFHDKKWDKNAVKVLEECFPGRKVISIYARQVLLGGGNIHCITQQEV